ncbi:SLBB domain-containing protein [Acidobacteria bacterium AH-259-A15]|nr:SLBB domain-containing protein [Acidobacteria bacterium AH-259-A15]
MGPDRRARGTPILTLLFIFLFPVSARALHPVPEIPHGEQRGTSQDEQPGPSQEEQRGASQEEAFVLVDGVPEPRVGRNDVLHITVWNGLNVEERTVKVAEDGTIFVPFGVNQNLQVEGLSSTDLKRSIEQELLKYFRQPVVQVVIEEYSSNRAYLLGELGAGPGAAGLYPLKGRKTVFEFIIEHGGFAEQANMTKIQINRASGEVLILNLSDVIFQGDESQNVIVNPGDIVWIPSKEVGANSYYVFGEVNSPGVVTAQEELSIVELISRSGSFTSDASRSKVFIARGDLNQPEIIELDLKKLVEKADFSQNVVLQNNDIIFVPRRGLAKYADVIAAISPALGLLRDTVFFIQR